MNTDLFKNISEDEIKHLKICLDIREVSFQKDSTIAAYMSNLNTIGIITEGTASIIRYDYNGNKTIIEQLKENSIFGNIFISKNGSEFSVVATSNCKLLFIEYDNLIKRCKKACPFHSILVDNFIKIMAKKIIETNEKVEILSNKTIREKLRAYFSLQMKKNNKKNITIPFTYTDLADYLSIDRSAMMREIKNLKDENLIKTTGKKITILY